MAPTTRPSAPLLSCGVVLKVVDDRERLRGVVDAPREADVELLQLAIEVGALEPRALRDLAHVALLASEQLLEVDALERFARLAQWQLEEPRSDLRCRRGIG